MVRLSFGATSLGHDGRPCRLCRWVPMQTQHLTQGRRGASLVIGKPCECSIPVQFAYRHEVYDTTTARQRHEEDKSEGSPFG